MKLLVFQVSRQQKTPQKKSVDRDLPEEANKNSNNRSDNRRSDDVIVAKASPDVTVTSGGEKPKENNAPRKRKPKSKRMAANFGALS